SPVAVVSASDPASQARAASLAVGLRAPMFTEVPGSPEALTAELERLGVDRVLGVGGAEVATDGIEVVAAPDGREDMEELTGLSFAGEVQIPADRVDDHTVHQAPGSPALLSVGEVPGGQGPAGDAEPFAPRDAAWTGDDAPQVLVHDDTPVSAIATAVAAGAAVSHLRAPDPRVDAGSVEAVRDTGSVLALGPGWGDDDEFRDRLEQARTVPELPGGGQLQFPGRRYVAAYGSPVTPALGILGEQAPQQRVDRVGRLVDAITGAEGYAVIDLQPGMADFLDQAKLYEDLLTRPGVGLALDPEWKMAPGQQPGAQVGTVGADEINRVIEWLADLTRDTGG